MFNNTFIPEPSLNFREIYTFSFIDNEENKYTRIYNLKSVTIKIRTCEDGCNSCWGGYYNCTDCTNPSYAILVDKTGECFPSSYIVENYIYDNITNQFLLCYDSCEFCSESGGTSSSQKCISCLPGYLYSYINLGNCYKYTNLGITEDKELGTNKFVSSICPNYRIAATGECVDECPTTSPYYTYEYNNISKLYEKINNKPPKYVYKNACWEECPNNYQPDINNICVCNNAFYKDSNNEIICLPNDKCSNEYPYQYKNTKECYDSLDKCTHFFRDDCYDSCPDGKVELISQSPEIQNYIKEKLSLDNSLINKICICDITDGVWSNIKEEKSYYQKCLTYCPYGYAPEETSKQCLRTNMPTTILQTTIPIVEPTTIHVGLTTDINIVQPSSFTVIPSTVFLNVATTFIRQYEIKTNIISTNILNTISSFKIADVIQPSTNQELLPQNLPPYPPINDQLNCPFNFENICYTECPQGTCLTQEDPKLKTCVRMSPNTQVFINICFEHFESLTNNIKAISERNEVLETNSGIIIRGYSTKNKEPIDKDAQYSIVYLGDCEYKLKSYYNLSNDIELFIL